MTDRDALATRRRSLQAGVGAAAVGVAGCQAAPGEGALFAKSFEAGMDDWMTHSHIGPEEP
jgi:hypothetical protein